MNKQIVVLGMPRSGTSMVAHILRLLGVFMGDTFPANQQGNLGGTCEDLEVSRINANIAHGRHEALPNVRLTTYGHDRMQAFINWRNTQHPTWGFKCVHTSWVAWLWDARLSNPRYILVERNPASVIGSFVHSWNYDPVLAAAQCEQWDKAHREFLSDKDYLHIRYEDLLETKDVRQIAKYVGTQADLRPAIDWIQPELNHYQMEAMSQ